jgi:hypothetical protein
VASDCAPASAGKSNESTSRRRDMVREGCVADEGRQRAPGGRLTRDRPTRHWQHVRDP